MRQSHTSTWLLTILTTYLSQTRFCAASPISDLWSVLSNGTSILQQRCATPCGYYGQVCCESGETCYTDPSNNQASCSAYAAQATAAPTAAGCDTCTGSWVYWTSTITITGSSAVCSTYSSSQTWQPTSVYVAPAPAVTTAAGVYCGSGQTSCGNICCASGQYCQWEGQCAGGAVTSYVQTSYASYTAPLRPTTIATSTVASTVGFLPAVTTGAGVTIASDMGGGGLSGGAIAGIVIGVIIGIIILILLCICCCFGAAASSILGFFGIGRKKERRHTETEEYYHRQGSRADGRTWYGSANRPPPKKKSSGIGGAGLLAALAGVAAAIGLGKRKERKRRDEKSDYTSSYGSYTSYCEYIFMMLNRWT